ncbi:hypothetical protein [Paenibacillus sp. FSL R10-2734]|uniref:hypothetical protein n=1 Tax=Paenibacillus sp. FSL R10-2734 TaxID=2954691 RepID=UPI0030D82B83
MNELQDVPLWLWVCIAVAVMLQGTLLFRDARRRGRKAWFWGLWGMTTVPSPAVVYLLVVILPERRRRKKL